MHLEIPLRPPLGLGLRSSFNGSLVYCRNLIKKPWPYNPPFFRRIHFRNPNKGPGFLNQVPTLLGYYRV